MFYQFKGDTQVGQDNVEHNHIVVICTFYIYINLIIKYIYEYMYIRIFYT